MLLLEIEDQPLDALALQAEVAARRTAAADDGQLALLRIERGLGLLDVDQRRMTTCSPLSDTRRAGIAFSAPAKNRFSSSVSMKSSR
jgi:hypothetical protein